MASPSISESETSIQSDITDIQPTRLTSFSNDALSATEFTYTECLPDYPQTSQTGHCYVINYQNHSSPPVDPREVLDDIQYSKTQITRRKIWCQFLKTYVLKINLHCSGVKVCEYLKPELKNLSHSSYNDEIHQIIASNQWIGEKNYKRQATFSFYHSIQKQFQNRRACSQSLPSCTPLFLYYEEQDVRNKYIPYIACHNWEINPQCHFDHNLKRSDLDIELLHGLFSQRINPIPDQCSIILQQKSTKKKCGLNHPAGSGQLKKMECGVRFYLLIPVDITTSHFYLFISQGIHTHPPPPPTKIPLRLNRILSEVIARDITPDMTRSTFMKSPAYKEFCQRHNAHTLSDIHQSLNNLDALSAILQRQKLIHFPADQHYNGVFMEMEINPELKEYIQGVYHDPEGIMLICSSTEQIKLLQSFTSFEVDISYKRIRQKDLNEVVFSVFIPEYGKIMTLMRVYTTQENPLGYYRLFKRVFSLIQEKTGESIKFHYLHQAGFRSIVTDMDTKQREGLALYLQELNPDLDKETHLQSILIFCRVHFYQNIKKAAGTHNNT